MIAQRTIDSIFDSARIEDVVEDFVNLKNSGSNKKGLCPFHSEKTPSFMVSPVKNIYKCFGCGKGGNSVDFIMEHEGLSYPESLRYLAKKFNIPIEENKNSIVDDTKRLHRDSLYLLNSFANDFFKENLLESSEGKTIGLSYFKERNYRLETIQKFELGYALEKFKGFTDKALNNKYKIESLQEIGLTSKKGFDFFRNRVIFPIHNISGKVIGFAGRQLNNNKKSPKYINSPESSIYEKRKVLYGLYFAKKAIRKSDECLLVEGYTDVISLHQAGIENVLASSGTSLTEDQIRLIKRFTNRIKIVFDGDAAGINAAKRGIEMILEQGMDVQLVLLPKNEDPDSYLFNVGSEAFQNYLASKAQDFILFRTEAIKKEAANDPIRKTRMLNSLLETVNLIPDYLKKNIYIQEISRRLEVDEAVLMKQSSAILKNKKKVRSSKPAQPKALDYLDSELKKSKLKQKKLGVSFNDEYQERDLIRLIIALGDKIYQEENNISVCAYILMNTQNILDTFDNPLYSKILKNLVLELQNNVTIDKKYFIQHPNEEIRKISIDILAEKHQYSKWEERGYIMQTQDIPERNFVKDSLQAIMRLKERKLKESRNKIEQKIKNLEAGNEKEKTILLKSLNKITKLLNEVRKSLGTVVPSA